MPIYSFQNKNNEIADFFFPLSTAPSIGQVVNIDGKDWKRLALAPQVGVDTKINPESSRDFVEKTGKKKGNLGNLFDEAKSASQQREKIYGRDPVKEKAKEQSKKKRKGKEIGSLFNSE